MPKKVKNKLPHLARANRDKSIEEIKDKKYSWDLYLTYNTFNLTESFLDICVDNNEKYKFYSLHINRLTKNNILKLENGYGYVLGYVDVPNIDKNGNKITERNINYVIRIEKEDNEYFLRTHSSRQKDKDEIKSNLPITIDEIFNEPIEETINGNEL